MQLQSTDAMKRSAARPPGAAGDLHRLQRYLRKVARVFDVRELLQRPADAASVIDYYTKSRDLFRRVHSSEGAIHMALNYDGVFRAEGYYAQARLVEARLAACGAKRVLEIGCGAGFNLAYLALQHHELEFFGIDLTPAHVDEARSRASELPNLHIVRGDFHALPWTEAEFDLIYEVEAMCHVQRLSPLLHEVFRVLRPGGLFLLFDGCRRAEFRSLPEPVRIAARLVEQAMAIDTELLVDDVYRAAVEAGFRQLQQQDITAAALPTVRRLQRLAFLFFAWPWLARQLLARDPALINCIAVLLTPETIRAGAHAYYYSILERPFRTGAVPVLHRNRRRNRGRGRKAATAATNG